MSGSLCGTVVKERARYYRETFGHFIYLRFKEQSRERANVDGEVPEGRGMGLEKSEVS